MYEESDRILRHLPGGSRSAIVPQLACDQSIQLGFADVATAIGTGAGFILGDAKVETVLKNRNDLQRPMGVERGAEEEEIKVFLGCILNYVELMATFPLTAAGY